MFSKFGQILSLRLIFVLAIINLAVLDIWVVKNTNSVKNKEVDRSSTSSSKNPLEQAVVPTSTTALCPTDCIFKISEATSSLKLSQPESKAKAAPSSQSTTTSIPLQSSTVKEFFVPFGSGSNSAGDWSDVSGLAAYLDTTQYGQIKSVYFETSIHIPTGNETASVRLFNVTDKHPVWFSEVSIEGGTPKLLISDSITLDSGRKLYQVQMKTSLKYEAVIDQARVHITTY